MEINFLKIYFQFIISVLIVALTSCGSDPLPAYEIKSHQGELIKTYFNESGDTLLSVSLDTDSTYLGSYRLSLKNSDYFIEATIDGKQLHGDYRKMNNSGVLLTEGYFYKGEKHASWFYFRFEEDSVRLEYEKNFLHGQPFGRQINYKSGEGNFNYLLIKDNQRIGWGSSQDDIFFFREGTLNFYDYVKLDKISDNYDLIFFIADVPGAKVELGILDEDEDEMILRELIPDGWLNGMWYFEGRRIESKTSLTVKTLDLKLLDVSGRDIYRDFIILPFVF